MMQMAKKEDRRVIRTKKAIRSAFAKLLSEREYNDITVTDIAEEADINRKTFYNYYRNTEDLVADIESEAIAAFDAVLVDLKVADIVERPEQIVARIGDTVSKNLDFFHDFLVMSNNDALFSRIADSLKKQIRKNLENQDKIDPIKAEVLSVYITSGTLSVYREWIRAGEPRPREPLDEFLTNLTIACVRETVKA